MGKADIRQFTKKLEEQGFEVGDLTPRGHWPIYKNGKRVSTMPSSPSDRRGRLNLISELKKHGYVRPKRGQ